MQNILFVDDDPVVTLLYTKFLGKHGFTLHTASNGLEAIHKLRTENRAP
jgi:CheY-like chemotaxis protein